MDPPCHLPANPAGQKRLGELRVEPGEYPILADQPDVGGEGLAAGRWESLPSAVRSHR